MKLKQELEALKERQTATLGSSVEVRKAFQENGKLNRAQLLKLGSAAREQADLTLAYSDLSTKLEATRKNAVYAFLMGKNATDSTQATAKMNGPEELGTVNRRQREIIRRIDVILRSIEEAMERIQSEGAGGGGGGGGQGGKKIPLEQIIALREELAAVADRTAEILAGRGEPADEAELTELKARQRECYELLNRLVEEAQ
jgi:hypothetical protein